MKKKPKESNYAVILAGGRGERFWPWSTASRPKQLLPLLGGKPLVAEAVERARDSIPPERIFVITNANLAAAVRRAAPELPAANVVGEPVGRDTAAAVAVGAALVSARDPHAVFCVLTADHVITETRAFANILKTAFATARDSGCALTIGIEPTFPCTGYGYIETGKRVARARGVEIFKAARFVEKPSAAKARKYMAGGRHLWNSGMFAWSIETLAGDLERHCPELFRLFVAVRSAAKVGATAKTLRALYPKLEKLSIDYALMEKADNILVVKGRFGWDDVGSWSALRNHFEPDKAGNVALGGVELLDCSGNVVVSRDGLVAMLGVRDTIVVREKGVTMVCPRSREQDIKKLTAHLAGLGRYKRLL